MYPWAPPPCLWPGAGHPTSQDRPERGAGLCPQVPMPAWLPAGVLLSCPCCHALCRGLSENSTSHASAGLRFSVFLFSLKDFVCLILERRGGEGERERTLCERYIHLLPLSCPQVGTWPATQACALTRNQTVNLWVRRPMLSPLSPTSQGRPPLP